MLRKSVLGLVAMVSLIGVSAGTASAHHHHCYPNYGYGYGYRTYAPRVVVRPVPVYPYAQTYSGAYVQPGYVQPGYVQPGLGVSTPGWGFYVR